MKYCLNLLFVIHLLLPNSDGYEQIDGSFTKKLTKGKINHYSELYQNGSREFAYKYFDKIYRLIVDVPENVDRLEGIHICSDIMLTIFLRDSTKNIWQCDFPGYFENPIKMACQKLGKTNSTICTDRHQKNLPIFMKNSNPNDSHNEASTTWTVILICCVIGLIGIIVFASLFIWRNFKKDRLIKNSSKSSTLDKSKHGNMAKQEPPASKSETIELKKLLPHNDEDKRSPAAIKAQTEEEEEKKRKQTPKSTPSVTIPSPENGPSSDVINPENPIIPLKAPNIKLSIPNKSKESSHSTMKFQNRTPQKQNSKSINFEEDSTPLLDISANRIPQQNALETDYDETEIPEECLLKITKYYQQKENSDEQIENEYENIASSNISAKVDQRIDIAPDISFNSTATHIVTIGPKTVSILDRKTKESYDFPAAIDYSKNPPKIGVEYTSPTVITSNIYFDDTNNEFIKEEHHEMNGIFQYFALMINNEKKLINKQKIIVDLLHEVTNIIESKAIILTIPSHFAKLEESLFLEAAKIAGFKDIQPLDENLALAYGIKNYYGIGESFIVIKECHSKTVIFVFDRTISYLKIIENVFSEFNTAVDFEADVDESEPNKTKTTYDISFTEIIDRYLGSQNEPSIAKYLCLVNTANSLKNLLVDKYSLKMKLIVTEDYEKLTTEGTKFLCC